MYAVCECMRIVCRQTYICAWVGQREILSVIPQERHPACYLRQGLSLVSPAPNRLFVCQYESIALFDLSFATYCGVAGGVAYVVWLLCHWTPYGHTTKCITLAGTGIINDSYFICQSKGTGERLV